MRLCGLSSLKMRFGGKAEGFLLRIMSKGKILFVAMLVFTGALLQQISTAQSAGAVPYIHTMEELHKIVGNTPVPILIQFDATWCGYCKALHPHMQKLHSSTSRSALLVYKVDVDTAQDVAAAFGVEALPTLFIIHKGEAIATTRGGMNERELFDWVKQSLRRQ